MAERKRTVATYVALGDSFTAGNGAPAGERWADRVAALLRAREPRLSYDNLAVDGAASGAVLEQVPGALALRPDLVTVVCGANDVLLTARPDLAGYERNFDRILARLGEAGPRPALLTMTAPESWRFMALGPRTRARLADALVRLNEATRAVAARHAVPCLEVADHPALADPANFGPDGLHPSALGHERAAAEIAAALRDELGVELDLAEGDD